MINNSCFHQKLHLPAMGFALNSEGMVKKKKKKKKAPWKEKIFLLKRERKNMLDKNEKEVNKQQENILGLIQKGTEEGTKT